MFNNLKLQKKLYSMAHQDFTVDAAIMRAAEFFCTAEFLFPFFITSLPHAINFPCSVLTSTFYETSADTTCARKHPNLVPIARGERNRKRFLGWGEGGNGRPRQLLPVQSIDIPRLHLIIRSSILFGTRQGMEPLLLPFLLFFLTRLIISLSSPASRDLILAAAAIAENFGPRAKIGR